MGSPCYGCSGRKPGCHETCGAYYYYSIQRAEIRLKRQKEDEAVAFLKDGYYKRKKRSFQKGDTKGKA